MSVESVRRICRALPGVTEDVKWGNDLVFSVGGKMFAVRELQILLKTAYDIVVAKLPKSKRPGAAGRHLKR